MNQSSGWTTRSITFLSALLVGPICAGSALAKPHHTPDLAARNAFPTHALAPTSPDKPLTPAQQVALPDGGAPPPPHGYQEVEDTETALANYSSTVRTHAPLGLPGANAQQKTNGPNNLPSHFSIFGVPVIFNAPVRPPYQDEDTPATYAGHPSNGQTDILVNGDASPIH